VSDYPFDVEQVVSYIHENFIPSWIEEDQSYDSDIIHDIIPAYIEEVSTDYIEVSLLSVNREGFKSLLIYDVSNDDFEAELKIEVIDVDFSLN